MMGDRNQGLEGTIEELRQQLREARDEQAATREILRVISISPANPQPVFDAIAQIARRLCDGKMSALYCFDGKLIHHIAHHNWTAEGLEVLHRVYLRALSSETQIAQAILEGALFDCAVLITP
jgi:hypothetical protein